MRKLARLAVATLEYCAAQIGSRDLALALGLTLAGYGAHQVYAPAGFLLPGLVLAAVAVFGPPR